MRISFYFFIAVISIFLFFEGIWKDPEIQEIKNYRAIHCFYHGFLFLCPDEEKEFLRHDGKIWKVTTNSYGERITPRTAKKETYRNEIWMMGDSIAYGYLVSDTHTLPYLLDEIMDFPVRNLGVDSLGTLGIQKRLEKALRDHPQTEVRHLIWIYNSSDFMDDKKDTRLRKNRLLQYAYFLHHETGKRSNLYNLILKLRKNPVTVIPETDTADPAILDFSHTSYRYILELVAFIEKQKQIKNFVIVIYPGMHIRTKKPDIDSPVIESVVRFLDIHSIPYHDLRKEFAGITFTPYFLFDGHLNEEGYRFMMKKIISLVKLP